ncbi:MAG TPA: 4'-phosphopantetheinyl transferase superfamily protein, partial [Gammaproteobacteria bacterium]|nr:4'-phosphopantetheinyl transferase superfamily protein [Gammaproteobacteria bacterium]
GVAPRAITFTYGPHGKPRLGGKHASCLRFNVSHAGEVAALAFADRGEIGVDIEALRPVPDAEAIARGFGSMAERSAWDSLAPRQKLLGFFNWWTRKEAFVKACGGGLSAPLDTFDVSFTPGTPARLLRVAGLTGDQAGWTLHAFIPGPRLAGAVACMAEEREAETRVACD